MNPREEIAHLTEVLERANHQYYVLDAPEMEDYEYDRLPVSYTHLTLPTKSKV